jgi:hypothetical protein
MSESVHENTDARIVGIRHMANDLTLISLDAPNGRDFVIVPTGPGGNPGLVESFRGPLLEDGRALPAHHGHGREAPSTVRTRVSHA